jgi:hypothetical protein
MVNEHCHSFSFTSCTEERFAIAYTANAPGPNKNWTMTAKTLAQVTAVALGIQTWTIVI